MEKKKKRHTMSPLHSVNFGHCAGKNAEDKDERGQENEEYGELPWEIPASANHQRN